MDDDLRIGDVTIPASELHWRFSPSSGPGGQHANRAATRAELIFDLAGSAAFPDKEHMLRRLGPRAPGGVVTVVVDESRSQWRNRQLARARLRRLLIEARRVPKVRRPTRPSAAARRRRLENKRRRSQVKRLRSPPDME